MIGLGGFPFPSPQLFRLLEEQEALRRLAEELARIRDAQTPDRP